MKKAKPKRGIPDKANKSQTNILKPIFKLLTGNENIFAAFMLIFSSTIGLILRGLFPGIAGDAIGVVSGLFVILLVFISRNILLKKIGATNLAIGGTVLLVLFGLFYFFFAAFYQQRTIYFVVDVSTNMEGLLQQIKPRLLLETSSLPDTVKTGLAIYGGQLRGGIECEDATEIVPSKKVSENFSIMKDNLSEISEFTPTSAGSLSNAITYSIEKLKDQKGLQQIIIFTSKVDTRCGDLPDKSDILAFAKKNNLEVQITIVTLGNVSENDKEVYEGISDIYQPIDPTTDLASQIDQLISIPPDIYEIVYP